MNKKYNKIKFLSDLEGTLFDEKIGYNDEQFYNFVTKLSKLANTLEADIDISILSPMGASYIKRMIDKMDKSIRLNASRNKQKYGVSIETIIVDGRDISDDDLYIRDKRIIPISDRRVRISERGASIKSTYTNEVIKSFQNKKYLVIYAGNGDNDAPSMNIIKRLPSGITICPNNSSEHAKQEAMITSKLDGVIGTADCVESLIHEIEERKGIFSKNLNSDITK